MSLSRPVMSAIRFGYGIRPGESLPGGSDDLLAQLTAATAPPRFPDGGIAERWRFIADYYARMSDLPKNRDARRAAVRPLRREVADLSNRDLHARVIQSVSSPHGFHERLAAFWTDHFAVSVRKRRPMYLYTPLLEAEVIRPLLAGSFSGLLRNAITHPAMLIYLDQVKSFGPNSRRARKSKRGLNENLGRELLELHTIGMGTYDQSDVRSVALVLTGLNIDRKTGRTTYRAATAEPGPIEVRALGRTYGGEKRRIEDVHALLDDLAGSPHTARHICRKLVVHFIADEPPEPLIDAMVEAWQVSNGDLGRVYAAMLSHPLSWEDPGRKARQPFDYIVTGLRAARLDEQALAVPPRPVADQQETSPTDIGMAPMTADGQARKRPEAESMATENAMDQTMAPMTDEPAARRRRLRLRARANPLTVGAAKKLGQSIWEPSSPEGSEEAFGIWISASQLTGRIAWAQSVAVEVGNRTDPEALAKDVLRDAARDETLKVVAQAPSRQAGLALLLASPEFNRR